MMASAYIIVLFAIGAALIAAAIGLAWYRVRIAKAEGPVNARSNILATVGGIIAGVAILLGFLEQGFFK
jgi:hypothetical protein